MAFDELASRASAEPSSSISQHVMAARQIQQLRYKDEKGIHCNAQMNSRLLHKYAWSDSEGLAKLKERMERLSMSARAFDRIPRVARTIADLENAAAVGTAAMTLEATCDAPLLTRHLTEAIGYRNLDRESYGQTF